MLLNVEESYAGENEICSKVLLSNNMTNLNKAVFISLSQVLQDILLWLKIQYLFFIHTITVNFNKLAFKTH